MKIKELIDWSGGEEEEEKRKRATRGKKEENGLPGECPLIVLGKTAVGSDAAISPQQYGVYVGWMDGVILLFYYIIAINLVFIFIFMGL